MDISAGTMQLALSMVIMQVTTSVAFMQVLRCTGMLVDVSITIKQVTVSVAIMRLSFWSTYVTTGDKVYCIYAGFEVVLLCC